MTVYVVTTTADDYYYSADVTGVFTDREAADRFVAGCPVPPRPFGPAIFVVTGWDTDTQARWDVAEITRTAPEPEGVG